MPLPNNLKLSVFFTSKSISDNLKSTLFLFKKYKTFLSILLKEEKFEISISKELKYFSKVSLSFSSKAPLLSPRKFSSKCCLKILLKSSFPLAVLRLSSIALSTKLSISFISKKANFFLKSYINQANTFLTSSLE